MRAAVRGAARSLRAAIANPVDPARRGGLHGRDRRRLGPAGRPPGRRVSRPAARWRVGVLGLVRMLPATLTGTLAGVAGCPVRQRPRRWSPPTSCDRSARVGCAVGVWLRRPDVGRVHRRGCRRIGRGHGPARPVGAAAVAGEAARRAGRRPTSCRASARRSGTIIGPLLGGILVASVSQPAAMAVAAVLFAAGHALRGAALDAAEDRGDPIQTGRSRRSSGRRSIRQLPDRGRRGPDPALVIVDFLTAVAGARHAHRPHRRRARWSCSIWATRASAGSTPPSVWAASIGAVGAASLGGRVRLSRVFALSLALWGLPIAVMGAWPVALVAIGAMIVTGLSNASLDIAGFTMLQRSFPPRERLAAFGLLEGAGRSRGRPRRHRRVAPAGPRRDPRHAGADRRAARRSWQSRRGPGSAVCSSSRWCPKTGWTLLRRVPLFAPLEPVDHRTAG